jgi:hypothetical protein
MTANRSQRFVKLATFLLPRRRLDLVLGVAFLGLISLVIAWEWLRGSPASDFVEQTDGEILCYIGDVAPGSKST